LARTSSINRKHMKKLATLLASLVLVASVHAGEFPDISIEELKQAIASKKVTLIDVNGQESYKKGHIPSAVEFGTIKTDLAGALPKDKKALVVAYCGGPKCQAYTAAATAAKKLGYKNVKHLSAGISGWMQAGEKTEKPNSKS
jgi:rhodanese-related sulfurtransferase